MKSAFLYNAQSIIVNERPLVFWRLECGLQHSQETATLPKWCFSCSRTIYVKTVWGMRHTAAGTRPWTQSISLLQERFKPLQYSIYRRCIKSHVFDQKKRRVINNEGDIHAVSIRQWNTLCKETHKRRRKLCNSPHSPWTKHANVMREKLSDSCGDATLQT